METNDIKKIWKTLANNNVVEEQVARENIQQIIARKGNGLLGKLNRQIRKEINTDIVTLAFLVVLTIGVTIYQNALEVEKMAYPVLLIIILFYSFKLARDWRKKKLLELSNLTGSIRETTLKSYNSFKKQLKQDYLGSSVFIFGLNVWVAFVYWQTFGHVSLSEIEFNLQYLGFIILIVVFACIILVPLILKVYYKKKYKDVLEDFELTLDELNTEEV